MSPWRDKSSGFTKQPLRWTAFGTEGLYCTTGGFPVPFCNRRTRKLNVKQNIRNRAVTFSANPLVRLDVAYKVAGSHSGIQTWRSKDNKNSVPFKPRLPIKHQIKNHIIAIN